LQTKNYLLALPKNNDAIRNEKQPSQEGMAVLYGGCLRQWHAACRLRFAQAALAGAASRFVCIFR